MYIATRKGSVFMCGRKDYYTDEEFWEQNPYPDHPDNDAYDIGDTPYLQDEDGIWRKVKS